MTGVSGGPQILGVSKECFHTHSVGYVRVTCQCSTTGTMATNTNLELAAIPLGYYWINPQSNTIMVYGSGNQRNSMCRVGTAAKAVCDVLANPSNFKNRPVYVADHTVSMNQLVPILEELRPGWNVVKIDLDEFVKEARRLWDEDTEKGVQVRLLTPGKSHSTIDGTSVTCAELHFLNKKHIICWEHLGSSRRTTDITRTSRD